MIGKVGWGLVYIQELDWLGVGCVGLVWFGLILLGLDTETNRENLCTYMYVTVKGLLRRFSWSCGCRKVVEAQLSKMCVMFSFGSLFKKTFCIYRLRL